MAADFVTDKAMAALDTMAEVWAAKFQAGGTNLRGAVRVMLACPDAEDRLLRLIKQAHAEGLFEGFHAGKDHAALSLAQALKDASSTAGGVTGRAEGEA